MPLCLPSFRSVALAAAAASVMLENSFTFAAQLSLNITALTAGTIESDWTTVYYPSKSPPLLIGNDGGAATGGFHAWDLDALSQLGAVATGRTKLVATLYNVGVGATDLLVTIAQPDSIVRMYQLPSLTKVSYRDGPLAVLGDWGALCPWQSRSGNSYFFLFGKGGRAYQYLVRADADAIELVEVQSFIVPGFYVGCAVSQAQARMYLTEDESQHLYFIDLVESTAPPVVSGEVGEVSDATGVAVYASNTTGKDYIFVALDDVWVNVYEPSSGAFTLLGSLQLIGPEDIEVQGISIYQSSTEKYPSGALTFAIEADGVSGFGVASLDGVLKPLGISRNTQYDPRTPTGCRQRSKICSECSQSGYCASEATSNATSCSCFAGFTGAKCTDVRCTDNCSEHGQCVGPNRCKCDPGWGGLHCSFLTVEPSYETDAKGGDGDDPAIWISPVAASQSRIITTTKSEDDAGMAVFDLTGKLLQTFPAGQPNNVDIIYGFQAGDRKIDLAFAACRSDDTLCLFEITPNGTLTAAPGGSQPVEPEFTVYGSCSYLSRKTGKQYLFVNEKSSRYLQYELTSTTNGTLETKLVRDFMAGSGGQVEGCVTDEDNGWLFLGEEPSALWRYDAEPVPTPPGSGLRIAHVGDGRLNADVEGVALVVGATPQEGYIIVSNQGVSAYAVYRRAEPHEHVATFTITGSTDGSVDAVSNTDGVAAVGTGLGPDFPAGLVVVHDDANELPDGTTSAEASFKLVSLEKVLGAEPIRALGLLDQVDVGWDPRG